MKKLLLSVLFLGFFVSFFPISRAIAVQGNPNSNAQKFADGACRNIESRITTVTTRFENNKQRHATAYNNMVNRIQKFVIKLEKKGYNVSVLKTDLITLNEKVQKFTSDYQAFVLRLNESKAYACNGTQGQFRATLKEARQLMAVVKQDSIDVKNYYQTVIRPDILDIKAQNVVNNEAD